MSTCKSGPGHEETSTSPTRQHIPRQCGPPCVNVRDCFGSRYRIGFDPAYDARGKHRANLDPWMMTVPCRGGVVIYPHGGSTLAAEVDRHPGVARRLGAIPSVTLHQDGDREKTFVFDVTLFDRVAEVVRPRKRRRLSEGQRRAAAERLARVRPKAPA